MYRITGVSGLLLLTLATLSWAADPTSATVKGTVRDELKKPVANAHVYLESPTSGGYNNDTPQDRTDARGRFSIDVRDVAQVAGISVNPGQRDLEYAWRRFTLKAGETMQMDMTVFRTRTVVIDYAYQPDKSTNLRSGLTTGTIRMRKPNFGFRFAKGVATNNGLADDLRFECIDGEWVFRNFYLGKENGFYDAGEVPLDEIAEASIKGINPASKPCIVGHTYVVRTWTGEYAKFQVKSLEKFVYKSSPALVSGTVIDEDGAPVGKALVKVLANDGVVINGAVTNAKGNFTFAVPNSGDVAQISATPTGGTWESTSRPLVDLNGGEKHVVDFRLPAARTVVLDYAFQPDGSRALDKGTLAGVITCQRPNFHPRFATGQAAAVPEDFQIVCDDGDWSFGIAKIQNTNGFYDCGEVQLESVSEAPEKLVYYRGTKPFFVGHTYVVRTFEGKYGKFYVKSMDRTDGKQPKAIVAIPLPAVPIKPVAKSRLWKTADGAFEVEAELVSAASDTVKLKRSDNGKVITVRVEQLSADDKAHLMSRQ